MIIIWGARLYGKVDEVPGMFHVATKFGHLWYIPLIPMGSHIVLEQSGKGWRGVPVPLSGKSVLVAWLRGIGVAGTIIAGIVGLAHMNSPADHATMVGAFIASAVFLGLAIFAFTSKGLRHANYERALALGDKLGLSDEGRILLEMKFNRLTPEQAKAALEEAARDRQELATLASEPASAEVPTPG